MNLKAHIMKLIIAVHLFLISILSAMLFISCEGTGEFKDLRTTTDIELIAERDSIKVYKASYGGHYIFFTNKGGVTAP